MVSQAVLVCVWGHLLTAAGAGAEGGGRSTCEYTHGREAAVAVLAVVVHVGAADQVQVLEMLGQSTLVTSQRSARPCYNRVL